MQIRNSQLDRIGGTEDVSSSKELIPHVKRSLEKRDLQKVVCIELVPEFLHRLRPNPERLRRQIFRRYVRQTSPTDRPLQQVRVTDVIDVIKFAELVPLRPRF